jgi:undecaprenyl diphosphate synthase
VPAHVACVMDGNGRWAAARGLTRTSGHKAGLKAVRLVIEECSQRRIEALTLFAFSSENWRRPAEEVGSLMSLFVEALDREIEELHRKAVAVRCIGERRSLTVRLQTRIAAAEERTRANPGLKLQVALSYGGRWDIIQAAQKLARETASGAMRAEEITEERFADQLALSGLPASAIFFSGTSLTPSCISAPHCGRTSPRLIWRRHWRFLLAASAASGALACSARLLRPEHPWRVP